MSTCSRTAASTNGNDVINGTTGNDTLKGLDGNDRLFGDRGRDRLLGGDGNDTLIGGGGNDYFKGGRGSDTADYSDQSVDMRIHLGSEFARFINRSWADETLKSIENIVAGSGDDDITGNDDSNLLQGGDGDDYLNGGKGKDTLEGGAGNDTLDGGGGTDLLDGGKGFDIADYSGLTSDVDVEFGDGWDTTSNIIFLGKSWDPETLISIEGIWTGSGNDRIDASVFEWTAAEINGGAGDDTIFGGEGSDLLVGGDGNDVIYGSAGPSYDNYQYDTTNTSSDTLDGGDGDDTFYASYGAKDVFDGGKGNDTIHLSWRHLNDFFYEYDDGWAYELEYVLGAGLYVDLSEEEDNVFYIRDITNDSLPDAGESLKSIENVVLDDGNDYVIGTSGANEIRGGAGNDTLIGGKGKDKLVGGNGDDVLAGGGGTDTIRGGDGFDVADYSDVNADILADLKDQEVSFPSKSWKPETLDSIEGVYTGSGDDTLNGTGEDNMFDGGLGSDIIRGRRGIDTVSYASHDDGVDVNLANGVATNLWGNGDDFDDTLKSIENVIGGSGGDYIVGDSRSNRIDGGDGDDSIFGGNGDDIIVVSNGYDQLFGGNGTDTLFVDFSDEAIATTNYGESGYYNYWSTGYFSNFDIDLEVDISRGELSFELRGKHSASFYDFEKFVGTSGTDHVTGSNDDDEIWVLGGSNTVRGRAGNDLIQGASTYDSFAEQNDPFDSHPYGSSPFIGAYSSDELLYGGSGNDTIYGSGEMVGGSGDDELHAAGWYGSLGDDGFGILTMEGGSGADKFFLPTYFEETGSDYSDGSAMVVDIFDFDASEGDKIVLEVGEIDPEDDYQFEFIGEASAIDFRQAAYYREDDDLILQYDSGYYGGGWGELDHITIRLTDYTGELTESDILFV